VALCVFIDSTWGVAKSSGQGLQPGVLSGLPYKRLSAGPAALGHTINFSRCHRPLCV
jgi:hypothetical protein